MKMLISAGHTNVLGKDRGAAGNNIVEGVEACKIRDDVAARLRELRPDWQVIEDGAEDENLPLNQACAMMKTAHFGAEIHFNASDNRAATGVEVLAKSKWKMQADKICVSISNALGIKNRGYKPTDAGQHHRLAFCEAGGVIIEICFLSNPDDVQKYKINYSALIDKVAGILATF